MLLMPANEEYKHLLIRRCYHIKKKSVKWNRRNLFHRHPLNVFPWIIVHWFSMVSILLALVLIWHEINIPARFPRAHFTKDSPLSFKIKSGAKLVLSRIPFPVIWLPQIFALLSCHVQNFVVTTWLELRWEQNEITIKFVIVMGKLSIKCSHDDEWVTIMQRYWLSVCVPL